MVASGLERRNPSAESRGNAKSQSRAKYPMLSLHKYRKLLAMVCGAPIGRWLGNMGALNDHKVYYNSRCALAGSTSALICVLLSKSPTNP
jgi:hypothetical protein